MKVVISIPDHIYNTVVNTGKFFPYRFNTIKAIKNSEPIPKGHKIIDATAFVARKEDRGDEWDNYACYLVDKEPAIIETDVKEGAEE